MKKSFVLFFGGFILSLAVSCPTTTRSVTRSPRPQRNSTASSTPSGTTVEPVSFDGVCGQTRFVNNVDGVVGSQAARIIGGVTAMAEQYPWQAFLNIYDSTTGLSHLCGGSLISSEWVLTAAHCCRISDNPRNFTINLGSNKLTDDFPVQLSASRIISHEEYLYGKSHESDICLLQLSEPLTLNTSNIHPICLPESCKATCRPGKLTTITGWGLTTIGSSLSNDLQAAVVPIIEHSLCASKFESNFITDRMLCAGYEGGGSDACLGDSGGPLTCLHENVGYVIEGITSFGSGCGQAGVPGVYTRVCKYLSWIGQKTAN